MNTTAIPPADLITATPVAEENMPDFTPKFFGLKHMLSGEMLVFRWMDVLSDDYSGGSWVFYTLSNGGYYMAPKQSGKLRVCDPGNFYEGDLSADAAGIVATLYALDALAWKTQEERFDELFYQLRDYARQHVEAAAILGAID